MKDSNARCHGVRQEVGKYLTVDSLGEKGYDLSGIGFLDFVKKSVACMSRILEETFG